MWLLSGHQIESEKVLQECWVIRHPRSAFLARKRPGGLLCVRFLLRRQKVPQVSVEPIWLNVDCHLFVLTMQKIVSLSELASSNCFLLSFSDMAGNHTILTVALAHPSLSIHRVIFLYLECLFLIFSLKHSGFFRLKLPILRRYPGQCEDFLASFFTSYLFTRSIAVSFLSSFFSKAIKPKILLGFIFLLLSPAPEVFFAPAWGAADRVLYEAVRLVSRWFAAPAGPIVAAPTALAVRGPTALSEWVADNLGLEIFLAWAAKQAEASMWLLLHKILLIC